ncbi:hypothetical protein PR048_015802 [Dryococelus australis]|uniref:Uncharacterized protein n=1 Tax=Dryococelus australis TaxID=614101 RepID=A0ABQ9HHY6_9NEOP|nr:hypothetical protein PR048_015802 [Dryococelus australis]
MKYCTDHERVGDLKTELKVHEMRANAFYGLLKTRGEANSVIHPGDDCSVYDWKSAADDVLKPPTSWHFQFQKSNRIILTLSNDGSVVIQGEPNFTIEVGQPKSIVKRGKSLTSLKPTDIPKGILIGGPKLEDVHRLLTTHFGDQWESVERQGITKLFYELMKKLLELKTMILTLMYLQITMQFKFKCV